MRWTDEENLAPEDRPSIGLSDGGGDVERTRRAIAIENRCRVIWIADVRTNLPMLALPRGRRDLQCALPEENDQKRVRRWLTLATIPVFKLTPRLSFETSYA